MNTKINTIRLHFHFILLPNPHYMRYITIVPIIRRSNLFEVHIPSHIAKLHILNIKQHAYLYPKWIFFIHFLKLGCSSLSSCPVLSSCCLSDGIQSKRTDEPVGVSGEHSGRWFKAGNPIKQVPVDLRWSICQSRPHRTLHPGRGTTRTKPRLFNVSKAQIPSLKPPSGNVCAA